MAGRLAAPWALSVAAYQIWERRALSLDGFQKEEEEEGEAEEKEEEDNDSKLAVHRQKKTKHGALRGNKELFIIASESFCHLSSDDLLLLAQIEK